jgi:hypothetical protein
VIDKQTGLRQIDEAEWELDEVQCLNLHVTTAKGDGVHCWLSLRPAYCDRGHIQLNIDGPLNLDAFDSFPRYFFSFEEADRHTRQFLKWRLWRERMVSEAEVTERFGGRGERWKLWEEISAAPDPE